VTDAAAFQAAIDAAPAGAAVTVYVPAGAYCLETDVLDNGRIVSWAIVSGATFTGPGTLPPFASANYWPAPPLQNSQLALRRGTAALPVTEPGAVAVFDLQASPDNTSNAYSTVAGFAGKRNAVGDSAVRAAFFEAIDHAGWDEVGGNNFVEGLRAHGLVFAAKGSGYGAVSFAGALPDIEWTYIIGHEGVTSNSTADAPPPDALDPFHVAASFVATSWGTKKPDVAYMVNPFTSPSQRFRAGFGVYGQSVDGSAFYNEADVSVGLDLRGACSWAALLFPNYTAVRIRNGANTADHNVLYYDPADCIVIGAEAATVKVIPKLVLNNLPTAATGLAPGTLWKSGNTLKVA
jgi:hypothetical protein